MYCTTISPSPVRPYPVNLLRHTWLDLGLSLLCALAQARSLARPVHPNFELPGETLKTASGYIVPLPNNQFMYTNIVILLTILNQSFIDALYYCKLFGIKNYVLCLMSYVLCVTLKRKLPRRCPNNFRKNNISFFAKTTDFFKSPRALLCDTHFRENFLEIKYFRKNLP